MSDCVESPKAPALKSGDDWGTTAWPGKETSAAAGVELRVAILLFIVLPIAGLKLLINPKTLCSVLVAAPPAPAPLVAPHEDILEIPSPPAIEGRPCLAALQADLSIRSTDALEGDPEPLGGFLVDVMLRRRLRGAHKV